MSVFVTGGTGFIGGALVEALVDEGREVKALVRETSDVSKLRDLGVTMVEGDVTNPSSLRGIMEDCSTLYHLANIYSFWLPDTSLFYRVNVEGTRNVMEEARRSDLEKIIYTSTMAAVGQEEGEMATEETVHCGFYPSDYCKSKKEAEDLVFDLHDEHGLPVTVVAPAAVLGPGDTKSSGQFIIDFLNEDLPGKFYEDSAMGYVGVGDVVKGHMLAEEKGEDGEKYLLCSENKTYGEIFEMLSEISGVPAPKKGIPSFLVKFLSYLMEIKAFFTKNPPSLPIGLVKFMEHGSKVDNSKSKEELGMEYTPIREVLEEAVNWYWKTATLPDLKPKTGQQVIKLIKNALNYPDLGVNLLFR